MPLCLIYLIDLCVPTIAASLHDPLLVLLCHQRACCKSSCVAQGPLVGDWNGLMVGVQLEATAYC